MSGAWLREHQADLASEKLLEAAGEAFVEFGVARASMGDVARRAGCSRGTLYRYFANRDALNAAFVDHWAEIVAERVRVQVADIANPTERFVAGTLCALAEVRLTPATAVWFARDGSGIAAGMSAGSRVVESLVSGFVRRILGQSDTAEAERMRARWLVRVIVSLLTTPCESDAEERACIERFVAPVFLRAGSD